MSVDWSIRQVVVPHALDDVRPPVPGLVVRTIEGATMGTTWSASVSCTRDADLTAIRADAEACLDRVVAQMSTWRDTSDLSRFNRSANEWQPLPDALSHVLARACAVAHESGGAYDPTIGPLVELWGFGPAGTRTTPPCREDIERARQRCGWRQIEIDSVHGRARQPGTVAVDLSSIAKGFAVDLLCRALEDRGLNSYLVEIGGELRGRGTKPDGQPWWVAVETSGHDSATSLDLLIALHGLAVATSGDYRAGFQSGGRWYSHTIDPRNGYPVAHSLTSVTVLHEECLLADAWSTALLVLGPEAGVALADARGLAALFVSRTPDGLTPRPTAAFDALLRA